MRELRASDATALFDYFADPELTKYYDLDPFTAVEQAHQFIEAKQRAFREQRGIRWGIARKEDDLLIGTVGFHQWAKAFARAEIGYEVARSSQGQGVLSEVLPVVIQFGFATMELNRIEALFHPANVGSRRVLAKCGFQLEGTLRQYVYLKGEFWDAVMMSLLREEHRAAGGT